MRKLFAFLVLFLPCVGYGAWEGGVGLGLVRMDYANDYLQMLAERLNLEVLPLRMAWEVNLGAQFFPWLGIRGTLLSSEGGLSGRERASLSATAFGVEGAFCIGTPWGAALEAGVGAFWAWAKGLWEGMGPGFGLEIGVAWPTLEVGPLSLEIWLSWRWLPIPKLFGAREEISSRNHPALDFSGLYGGFSLLF